jgi:ribosomal protein S12 methylthiotransferase
MGQLKAAHIDVVHESPEPADIVIINTCGFINDAKEESINTILNYVNAKKNGLAGKVYVMGCLVERYKKDLRDEIGEVDGFFGVDALPEILRKVGAGYHKELLGERVLTTPVHYAYLKISEGCDRKCSFCAIPIIRGRHVSKPVESVLEEATWLAGKGVKEIMLIAQDLTWYGLDLYKQRKLAYLLGKLSETRGIKWIRLHYMYPADFPLDMLDVMKEHANICNYMDIPFQHISNPILRSMRRGIDQPGTLKLLEKIRQKLPDAALRTTLITGYPGETKKDFTELKEFVRQQQFDRLGVFAYSPEEGTPAFDLKDDVPDAVKKQRMEEIMEIQQQISQEKNTRKIGKEFTVIIDGREGEYYRGRTEFDSPEVDNEVLVSSEQKLKPGEFYRVLIEDAEPFDLVGRVI